MMMKRFALVKFVLPVIFCTVGCGSDLPPEPSTPAATSAEQVVKDEPATVLASAPAATKPDAATKPVATKPAAKQGDKHAAKPSGGAVSNGLPSVDSLPNLLGPVEFISKEKNLADMRVISDIKHPGIEKAMQVTIHRNPLLRSNVELKAKANQSFKKGDVLVLQFDARKVKTKHEHDAAIMNVSFPDNSPAYTKSLFHTLTAGRDWTRFARPFVVNEDISKEDAAVGIWLSDEQTIDIANVKLVKYPKGTPEEKLQALPVITYQGRKADAPWRSEAARKIDKLRKAEMTIRVVDAAKQPVANATVDIDMTRHAFEFGSVVSQYRMGNDKNSRKYRQIFEENFNKAVIENALKPQAWNREDGPERVYEMLDWLSANDVPVKGHFAAHAHTYQMIRYLPREEQKRLMNDPAALRAHIMKHIEDKLGDPRIKQGVSEWDVINHFTAYHSNGQPLYEKAEGWDVYPAIVEKSREVSPDAKFYTNEEGIMTVENTDRDIAYKKHIQYLVDKGQAPDGIGMMSHFYDSNLRSPRDMWKLLDSYKEQFGLPIKITELDVSVANDEQLHGDYIRDFLTAAFAHDAVVGIIQWGFWEKEHWRPEAALLREDFSEKPAFKAYRDLVFNQWWTDEQATTNTNGEVKTRGFLGDYLITVTTPQGQRIEKRVQLTKKGLDLEIVLPGS